MLKEIPPQVKKAATSRFRNAIGLSKQEVYKPPTNQTMFVNKIDQPPSDLRRQIPRAFFSVIGPMKSISEMTFSQIDFET